MPLIICPGYHDRALNDDFLQQCHFPSTAQILVFPAHQQPAYSPFHVSQFLQANLTPKADRPLLFISFSAGVVGAIAAAKNWQELGGNVKGFIALDGWGVPLFGKFPIHRLSHDYFTHWSSAPFGIKCLGESRDNFYADPPVDHLQLWRQPAITCGYQMMGNDDYVPRKLTTAAEFIRDLYCRYLESRG